MIILFFLKAMHHPFYMRFGKSLGKITENELMSYRQFGSPLEGHATMRFKYAEAATGSLGMGLSIGAGMALAARFRCT